VGGGRQAPKRVYDSGDIELVGGKCEKEVEEDELRERERKRETLPEFAGDAKGKSKKGGHEGNRGVLKSTKFAGGGVSVFEANPPPLLG